MKPDLIKILISSFISMTITFILSYIAFDRQYKIDQKRILNDNLNKIIDINMQYPFFEDSSFISRWNNGDVLSFDSSIRYQDYCLYIFNFAENVLEFYSYDTSKIEKDYDVKELIKPHYGWWKAPSTESYSDKTSKIIDSWYK